MSHRNLPEMFNKLPPHAVTTEAALLGSLILDGTRVGEVAEVLQGPDDFFKPAHATIYNALVALSNAGTPIDMVQLHQRLRDRNEFEAVGGLEYLVGIADKVPSAVNATAYARIVRQKAQLRELIDAAGNALQAAYAGQQDADEVVEQAEKAIFAVGEQQDSRQVVTLGEAVRESLASQERREAGETGIHTGFVELDDMLGGMRPGQLLIVAARPSMGKTAFALDLLRHAGVMQDKPVAMFSLEMSTEELGGRMACKQAGVNNYAYQRCMLDEQAMGEVQMASVTLGDAPVHIDDTAGISIMRLRARARRLAARHGIKLIVVDYLQLVTAPDYRQRREEVGAVSRGLKAIAKELSVPVVCLSQLNRQAESRDKHRPRMADLKESGDIEQDADVVMLLHREDYYHQDDPDWTPTRRGEVIVAKQRNGATGTVELAWDGPTMTFRNL